MHQSPRQRVGRCENAPGQCQLARATVSDRGRYRTKDPWMAAAFADVGQAEA